MNLDKGKKLFEERHHKIKKEFFGKWSKPSRASKRSSPSRLKTQATRLRKPRAVKVERTVKVEPSSKSGAVKVETSSKPPAVQAESSAAPTKRKAGSKSQTSAKVAPALKKTKIDQLVELPACVSAFICLPCKLLLCQLSYQVCLPANVPALLPSLCVCSIVCPAVPVRFFACHYYYSRLFCVCLFRPQSSHLNEMQRQHDELKRSAVSRETVLCLCQNVKEHALPVLVRMLTLLSERCTEDVFSHGEVMKLLRNTIQLAPTSVVQHMFDHIVSMTVTRCNAGLAKAGNGWLNKMNVSTTPPPMASPANVEAFWNPLEPGSPYWEEQWVRGITLCLCRVCARVYV